MILYYLKSRKLTMMYVLFTIGHEIDNASEARRLGMRGWDRKRAHEAYDFSPVSANEGQLSPTPSIRRRQTERNDSYLSFSRLPTRRCETPVIASRTYTDTVCWELIAELRPSESRARSIDRVNGIRNFRARRMPTEGSLSSSSPPPPSPPPRAPARAILTKR